MAKKRRRAAEKTDQGPPLPDRRAMEKMLREIAGDIGGRMPADTPLDRAQEIMYRAFEAAGPQQVRLARQALEVSPDCTDAYVLLAEHARTLDEARQLYEQGVAAGERVLGEQGFTEYAGHFWGFLETRPYMRAREGLANCLWEAGRREEAVEHFREMLRLNPNDNQGVRYSLATLLTHLGRDDEVERLLAEYEKDGSAIWAYTRVLLAFRRGGDSPLARETLKQVTKANKHVPAYLLGHKSLPPDLPPYITRGGEDEAVSYVVANRRVWLDTPGAISWLRQTLDVPLPKPRKPHRPSWPELKLALWRCPQERGEVWQVDALPDAAAGQGEAVTGTSWTLFIVSRASHELLNLEGFDSQPKPGELWDYLVDTMRKPRHAEPRRPARIEVRQKALQTAWKARLKQIGIECALSDSLESVDEVRQQLPSTIAEPPPEGPIAATSSPEDIFALPVEPGEVWQADIRRMPAWIFGEGQPYRPWMAVVVNRTDDLVLAHQVTQESPPAVWLWEAVVQAIRQPAIGVPHRPGAIEVGSAKQREALLPHLEQAGIECVALEELDHLDSVLDDMAQHLAGGGAPPSLLEAPGMEPAQVGSFYAAAAEFYRRKPWQQVLGDTPIKVECNAFRSGPWYAVVMGQSGVQQGLAVYEDLAALREMMTSDDSDEEKVRGMSALSLMFSEAFEIPVRDLDAAERRGWPVAGPEAYPLVIHVNPGRAVRPPLGWELALLEACLRTIPEFLAQSGAVMEKTVRTASRELTVRVSWASE